MLRPLGVTGSSPARPPARPRAISIHADRFEPLPLEPDGGVLIEPQTHSVVRVADAARHFLAHTTHFPQRTYVVCGPQGALHVGKVHLGGPAAVCLVPGTAAQMAADSPDAALLVCTQSRPYPHGYHPLTAQGPHADRYAEIARLNERMAAGRMPTQRLPHHSFERLHRAGLVARCPDDMGMLRWTVPSREMLANECQRLGFRSRLTRAVLDAYESSHRQQLSHRGTESLGYDVSGMVYNKDGIVAYRLDDRVDPWLQRPSEWLLSSIAYGGAMGPPGLGISMVASNLRRHPADRPFVFRTLRPSEQLHRHPVRPEGTQLELYHVTHGRAVLLTLHDGKPHSHLLEAHDMAAIQPGVPHCLLAAQGPYRHVVVQVPSTFQYGFLFKEPLRFEDFGLRRASLEKEALRLLEV